MELFSLQRDSALKVVEAVLNLEKYPLFTQNTHYLSSERELWLAKYKDALKNSSNFMKNRRPPSVVSPVLYADIPYEVEERPSNLDLALYYLRQAGYDKLSLTDLTRLEQARPVAYEEELEVMADVRAYYQVAHKVLLTSTSSQCEPKH